MANGSSEELLRERARLVSGLIRYGRARGYHLTVHDFDEFTDEVIVEETQWINQGNSSSMVFQLGERVAKLRR